MKSTGIFCDVYAGEHSTFAISKDAKVLYVWGLNNRGQLGTGDELSRYVPEVLPSDWLWDWTKKDYTMSLSIAGGSAHSIVTDNGSLYSMGANEYGQLGLPKEVKDTNKPMQVKIPAGLCMVACGTRCSFAITNEGRVYSWGIGSNYQLGSSEDDEDVFEPSPMQGNHLKDCTVLDVSSGGQHTALLVTSSSTNNDNNNN
jgi:regulator of chromosome condensation